MRLLGLVLFLSTSLFTSSVSANDAERKMEIRREWNEFINAWFPNAFQIDCPGMPELGAIFVFEKNILGKVTVKNIFSAERGDFRPAPKSLPIERFDVTSADTDAFLRPKLVEDLSQKDQLEIAQSFAQLIKPNTPKVAHPNDSLDFFAEFVELGPAKLSFDFVEGTISVLHTSPKKRITMTALPSAGRDISGKDFTSREEYYFRPVRKCFPSF